MPSTELIPQPPGLQTDLLKCSRATREWVAALGNEIVRLYEHASTAVKQGEHWHKLASAEFERGFVEGRAAQAINELQGRDRFLSTLDQQLATLNRIGEIGRKLAQDIPRGTNAWADALLDLVDTAKALGIKFDEYPQLGSRPARAICLTKKPIRD